MFTWVTRAEFDYRLFDWISIYKYVKRYIKKSSQVAEKKCERIGSKVFIVNRAKSSSGVWNSTKNRVYTEWLIYQNHPGLKLTLFIHSNSDH